MQPGILLVTAVTLPMCYVSVVLHSEFQATRPSNKYISFPTVESLSLEAGQKRDICLLAETAFIPFEGVESQQYKYCCLTLRSIKHIASTVQR